MTGSSASFDPRDYESASGRAARYVSACLSRGPREREWTASYELRAALEVAASLHDYRPAAMPERPLSFPSGSADDDQALKRALADARRALRPNADERTLLAEYGEWRHACARVRGESEGRVGAVIGAVRWLDLRGKGDPTAIEARALLVDFLRDEWGVTIGTPVPDYWQAKEIAREAISRWRGARQRASIETSRESDREERGW